MQHIYLKIINKKIEMFNILRNTIIYAKKCNLNRFNSSQNLSHNKIIQI